MNRQALEFVLYPSPRMAWLAAVAHGIALVPVWGVVPWLPASAVLTLCIALSCWQHTSAALATLEVRLTAGETQRPRAIVRRAGAAAFEGVLHGSTFMSARFLILRVRPAGAWRCRSIAIARARAGDALHRRLRVWLRWSAMPSMGSPAGAEPEPIPSRPVRAARR